MKVDDILSRNTKGKSLGDLIEMLGSVDDADAVFKIRKRHEEDTGVPMEEDDFGKYEQELSENVLPEISKRL